MEGFLPHDFGGHFGGAYTWRGLFSEFYGTSKWLYICEKGSIDVHY